MLMSYYFAMAQVRLDSQYMWNERSAILWGTANILSAHIIGTLGIAPFLDQTAFIIFWGVGGIIPISVMYAVYKYWINYKLQVRNGYIKIYFFA